MRQKTTTQSQNHKYKCEFDGSKTQKMEAFWVLRHANPSKSRAPSNSDPPRSPTPRHLLSSDWPFITPFLGAWGKNPSFQDLYTWCSFFKNMSPRGKEISNPNSFFPSGRTSNWMFSLQQLGPIIFVTLTCSPNQVLQEDNRQDQRGNQRALSTAPGTRKKDPWKMETQELPSLSHLYWDQPSLSSFLFCWGVSFFSCLFCWLGEVGELKSVNV